MTKKLPLFTLPLLLILLAAPTHAQPPDEAAATSDQANHAPLEETRSVTQHQITVDGQPLSYTATAGTLVIEDAQGNQQAEIFYVAYTKDGVEDPATRPVTFSYNGGPGAAAVWVHMGAFGPKKIALDPEGMPHPPPGELIDNPHTILDETDLVFIDPVSTGWSRPAPGVDPDQFHGLEGDVESVGELIRLWITRNERWASPKFLAGESYGTTRSAAMSHYLQSRFGMYLNGVMLISPVLNWLYHEFDPGNDRVYVTFLPTYAATAWYHGQLDPRYDDLEALLAEVEAFALGDYATALLQGDRVDPDVYRDVVERTARYTGLSEDFVDRANLRIYLWHFMKELLRDERKVVGRLDSRYTHVEWNAVTAEPEFDPSFVAVEIGYVTMLNDYLRRDLGYETDKVYRPLAREVWPWDYSSHQNRYVNVAEDLRMATQRNPDLRTLFLCGYYDFATPYFDCENTVATLGLPPGLRDNVEIVTYNAGHMMYVREEDHAKMKADVAAFIDAALAGRETEEREAAE